MTWTITTEPHNRSRGGNLWLLGALVQSTRRDSPSLSLRREGGVGRESLRNVNHRSLSRDELTPRSFSGCRS